MHRSSDNENMRYSSDRLQDVVPRSGCIIVTDSGDDHKHARVVLQRDFCDDGKNNSYNRGKCTVSIK
jgi:hypothetical protein